ncbi:hypothetical protein N0V82_007465 [Gnomoniopsis sp. IMI 355080]|nr:hypothetical protein N0V82_007465 [Gnomoniopsis sp. IMI 355080]
MASLCGTTRPEGFELKSRITIGLPTQCFLDVVFVPLPTWIYIFVLTTILSVVLYRRVTGLTARAARLQKRRSRVSRVLLGPADANAVKNKPWVRNTIIGIYYFLIAVVLGLESVEVARFVQSDMGIGLTPVVYGGCVIAISLRATKGFKNKVPGWQTASQLFWLVSAVVTLIKAVAVGRMLNFPGGRFAREDSVYPAKQQLAVQSVLVIVYVSLLITESVVQFLKPGYESTLVKLSQFNTPGEASGGIEMMTVIKN